MRDPRGGARPGLDRLRDELDDDEAVARFVDRYLTLLDERLRLLGDAIAAGRVEDGITLLLTLETSSHMVGADDLSLRAAALRLALGQGQADTARLHGELIRAGRRARDILLRPQA